MIWWVVAYSTEWLGAYSNILLIRLYVYAPFFVNKNIFKDQIKIFLFI